MNGPKITLEQWRVLQSIIDNGGYAQAAVQLHRSQSAVSYAVSKMQEQLGVALLQIEGRKAHLTPIGEVLLRRSRQLLAEAVELEQLAANLVKGREAEIRLVVDAAFPSCDLMRVLKEFARSSDGTRVQLNEVVLSGADEALLEGRADLAVASFVPKGFLGDALVEVEFVAVAHPEHALHRLGRTLTHQDLRRELQVVIRDSGSYLQRDVGWLGSDHRWTVTSLDRALEAISSGLGFGWLPHHQIRSGLAAGVLKILPLREGQRRKACLYMVLGHPQNVGPATCQLAGIFRQVCSQERGGT